MGRSDNYKHELLLHSKKYDVDNNSQYYGEKLNGLYHGYGIMYFPLGAKYEGYFCYGLKHGYGMLHLSYNNYLVGWWEKDHVHGEAIYSSDMLYVHGEWSNGELVKIFSTQRIKDNSMIIIY